jgi:hypothetical protein
MDSAGTARDALSASMVERVQGLRLPPPPANSGINASTSIAWLITTLSISGFVFVVLYAFVYQVGGPASSTVSKKTQACMIFLVITIPANPSNKKNVEMSRMV